VYKDKQNMSHLGRSCNASGADMLCAGCEISDGHYLNRWHRLGFTTSQVQRVMTGQCVLLVMFVWCAGSLLMSHGL